MDPYFFACLSLVIACAIAKAQSSRRLQRLREELAECQTEESKAAGQRRQLEAGLEQWRGQERELEDECRKLSDERNQAVDRLHALEEAEQAIREHRPPDPE